jgi:two-component system, OmpR family, phosphate regulon response regulator OmpR
MMITARRTGRARIASSHVRLLTLGGQDEAMKPQILLIDDDLRLAATVRDYLGGEDFIVAHASTGADGMRRHEGEAFDAIVLDVRLPDIDGFEVCRQIRAGAGTPILMLTANGEATDRILGLEMGADDCLPKPFELRELLARLRAILRRGSDTRRGDVLVFGRLEIDRRARETRIDGIAHILTDYQFELLLALAERPGRVMGREALMDLGKGGSFKAFDRSIDVHISRIRSIIEDDPRKPQRIITIRGAGYVFARTQD